jgi:HK97 family phage major capsid protein
MDDIPQLQSIIDGEMRWMLDAAEEAELLAGDGTGQHLLGLIPQATEFVAAFTPAMASRVDYIRLGMLQVAQEDYAADAVVLHPNDWARVELSKEATSGAYLFSNPTSGVLGPRLWGLPVVDTRAVDEGDFLVGAFRVAGQIFDRMGTEVLISSEDRDNFIKNMLTVRAEKRLGLVVRRPQALVYGTFPA